MPIKIGDATTRALFRMIVESRAAARAANPARRVDYRDAARDLAMRLDLPVRDLQRIAKQGRTERWGRTIMTRQAARSPSPTDVQPNSVPAAG